MISIVPHRSSWSTEFREIAAALREGIGEIALRVDHIGSTSVPHLCAKDVIDLQVTVARLDGEIAERPAPPRIRPASRDQRRSRTAWVFRTRERLGETLLRAAGPLPEARSQIEGHAMDFVSHALWGGVVFGRRTRRAFLAAAGVSLLPDLLTEGLFAVLYLMNIGDMPRWDMGHPDIAAYPTWAQYLYSSTHSFVLFILAFLVVCMLARKPVWVVGAWGLHILIDIPTHSVGLFPTPFLWPLSDFKVDGAAWHHPLVLSVNVLLLVAAYSLWLVQTSRRQRSAEHSQ